ncbi:bacterial regulatory s, tetR family protein, partial [Vibrio harveyi]
LRWYDRS